MHIFTDEPRDLRLLDLRGLTPLNPEMAAGEPELLAMIEGHNDRCGRAAARLRQLAADRRRLSDFAACERMGGTTLLAERARLRGESWDALWEARHALEEREDMLQQLEHRLREQYDEAVGHHDQAVETAKRRLVKERRALQAVNPTNAEGHFHDFVAADESVREAARRQSAAGQALNDIAEAKRGVIADRSTVTTRQREVFALLTR
ncbi:MAG: hypothetical protein HUU26_00535 [Gemmatimonadaceae bacterium]|nr:hypothetical protein [Phycisphaerae bacterium]NUQ10804.1 hypothetical protein [Gemmatimonadaceae bacterium]